MAVADMRSFCERPRERVLDDGEWAAVWRASLEIGEIWHRGQAFGAYRRARIVGPARPAGGSGKGAGRRYANGLADRTGWAGQTLHLLQTLDHLRSLNIAFQSIMDGIDTNTAAGRMVFSMVSAMA